MYVYVYGVGVALISIILINSSSFNISIDQMCKTNTLGVHFNYETTRKASSLGLFETHLHLDDRTEFTLYCLLGGSTRHH